MNIQMEVFYTIFITGMFLGWICTLYHLVQADNMNDSLEQLLKLYENKLKEQAEKEKFLREIRK